MPTAGENAGTSPLDGAAEEGGGVKMGRVRRLRRHPRGPSDSPSAVHGSRSGSDISDCIPSAGLPLDCPWTARGHEPAGLPVCRLPAPGLPMCPRHERSTRRSCGHERACGRKLRISRTGGGGIEADGSFPAASSRLPGAGPSRRPMRRAGVHPQRPSAEAVRLRGRRVRLMPRVRAADAGGGGRGRGRGRGGLCLWKSAAWREAAAGSVIKDPFLASGRSIDTGPSGEMVYMDCFLSGSLGRIVSLHAGQSTARR